jgi:hypothetical protein
MPKIAKLLNIAQAKLAIPDLEVIGNGDGFRTMSLVVSEKDRLLVINKVMAIHGIGCILHTFTQQEDNVSEAMLLLEGTRIESDINGGLKIVKL